MYKIIQYIKYQFFFLLVPFFKISICEFYLKSVLNISFSRKHFLVDKVWDRVLQKPVGKES